METGHEPCIGCNRPTRAGTVLFSDRVAARGEDGDTIFLCGDCNARAVSHSGRRLTPGDMRAIAARGAGVGFLS